MIDKNKYFNLTLECLFKYSSDMMFIKNKDLVYVGASDSFAKITSYEKGCELCGKTDFEIFSQELAQKYTSDDKKLMKLGENILDYVEPLPEKDGRKKYSSTSKFLIRDENGEIIGSYGVCKDITAEIELEEEKESKELSSQLFEAVLEADLTKNLMISAEGSVWIKKLNLLENLTYDSIVDNFVKTFISVNNEKPSLPIYKRATLLENFSKGITAFNHISLLCFNGEYRYFEFKTRTYFSRVSNSIKVKSFLKDVDEEIRNKENLKYKAFTDSLTGLLNRDGAEIKIKKVLEKSSAEKHALLFLDLDKFKDLNDNFGHLYGDKVLREIGEKLSNIANYKNIIGRYGGDEFIVFIENFKNINTLKEEVNKIIKTVQYYKYDKNFEVKVTCSVGVSIYTPNKDLHALYTEADKAMYLCKLNGKNGYTIYDELM